MIRFCTLLLLLMPTFSLACEVATGRYEIISESEFTLFFDLKRKGVFTLTHEYWQPGHYDQREAVKYQGTWSCSGNKISLNYEGESAQGVYASKSLMEPFGINKKSLAISFGGIYSDGLLSGHVYWPKKFLNEAFE